MGTSLIMQEIFQTGDDSISSYARLPAKLRHFLEIIAHFILQTNLSRKWPKQTKPVCLTDFMCALCNSVHPNKKLEIWWKLYGYATDFS